MDSYTIYFTFRGEKRFARVHQHIGHAYVFFLDGEIIRDFGGRVEFNDKKEPVTQSKIPDHKDFFRAVGYQLR